MDLGTYVVKVHQLCQISNYFFFCIFLQTTLSTPVNRSSPDFHTRCIMGGNRKPRSDFFDITRKPANRSTRTPGLVDPGTSGTTPLVICIALPYKAQHWTNASADAADEADAVLPQTLVCMYVCTKNLCSRSSLQPRLSRRRYDQL